MGKLSAAAIAAAAALIAEAPPTFGEPLLRFLSRERLLCGLVLLLERFFLGLF